ncbi:MAG: YdcF family protein [Pseudomonadota bacterium]
MSRFLKRISTFGIGVYVMTLAAITAYSTLYTNSTPPPRADAIVCLGAGVDENGVLDPAADARARTCAKLYADGVAPRVHFTGGNDAPNAPSGGQAMAHVAHVEGVPEAVTTVEHESRSTLQNALFSKPQIDDVANIIIVTDAFHLPRSAATFAAMGDWDQTLWASDHLRPNPFWGEDWTVLHRETLAIWFNLLRYSAWRGATALGVQDIDHWLI